MNWHSYSIELPEGRIALQEKGKGKQILLCLHGYRQSKRMFHPFFAEMPEGWRVVVMDLPLFGETEWFDPAKGIEYEFLQRFWNKLREHYPEAKFHLLGFSMGGWVAMALQRVASPSVGTIFLLAPDGIRSQFWHRFVRTNLGGWLLIRTLNRPQWVLQVSEWLYNRQWLDAFSYRFVQRNFTDESLRQLLLMQLKLYAPLRFSWSQLIEQAREPAKVWHLIWGKHDQVLPWQTALRFTDQVPNAKLHLVEAGHMLLAQNPEAVRRVLDEYLFGK